MICKILLLVALWCMGLVLAEDIVEFPGGAEGSIATSCKHLYLHVTTASDTDVLSLFGYCTYDSLPHDFAIEPEKFRKSGLDLTKIIRDDAKGFHWATDKPAP